MKRAGSVFAGALAALIATSGAGYAERLQAESAGASGLTTIVLQVTARALDDSDTSLQINTDQTLTRSALKLAADKIDVAIVPPGAYLAMTKGVGPYKENPDQAKQLAPNLRSLFGFTAGTFHPVVFADSGIESWDDIRGKRVFSGPPGGAAGAQIEGLLRVAGGLEPGEDYESIKMGWGAAVPAFQDGQFDVLVFPTALGSASLVQLALLRDIRMLGVDEEIAKSPAFADFLANNGAIPGRVPAGLYQGQVNNDAPVETAGYTLLNAVNASMSDDVAYELTAAFWDNLENNKKDVALLAYTDMTPFAGNPMPLHPGAVKYYREKGLDIPENLIAK